MSPLLPTLFGFVLALLPARTTPAPPAVRAPISRSQTAPSGRPLVLLVHGRGQLGDTAVLRRDALAALRAGAEATTGTGVLRDGDVQLVWYADLLGGRTDARPASCAAVASGGAAGTREGGDPLGMLAMLAGALFEMAGSDSLQSAGADALGGRALRGMLGDVRFVTDAGARCAAESRIGDAIDAATRSGRPVVVVAHSLGGLLAWSHLAHRTGGAPVQRLVTVGSPVGSREVRGLLFGRSDALTLPRGVASWVNVIDDDDPFAAPLRDADDTSPAPSASSLLRDVRTEARHDDTHALQSYLRDAATTHAVLDAWCDAARAQPTPDRESIASCATLAITSPTRVAR